MTIKTQLSFFCLESLSRISSVQRSSSYLVTTCQSQKERKLALHWTNYPTSLNNLK